MLRVSEIYAEEVVSDHRKMPYRITLGGTRTYDQSHVSKMTLDERVGGGSSVALGTANSSMLRFTLKGKVA